MSGADQFVPPEIGWRLAGYTDGEGSFVIRRQQSQNGRRCVSYGCGFAILVREDDAAILDRFRETIGYGTLFYSGERAQTGRDNKPFVAWRIDNQAGCLALVDIFERFPLWSKKARDFAIWAQAVRYWCGPRPEGQAPLERWFHEIRAVREYVPGELRQPEEVELDAALF